MIIIKQAAALREFIDRETALGKVIGFVPTMGALHAGHLDLVGNSGGKADVTVCSIFVNPTQFNDRNDFDKYPQTLENDILLLGRSPADVLFLPSIEEVYPTGMTSLETYDLGYLETILEGKYRPGHFQGVCQVMYRLLQLVRPHKLFMGQKDYQQCMVVDRMLQSLDFAVELVKCPTIREPDGLAMSSRNLRITADNRPYAPLIFETMNRVREEIAPGDLTGTIDKAALRLSTHFKPDYFEIADASTLEPVRTWDGRRPLVVLAAAFLAEVRLIDNLLVTPQPAEA